MLPRKFSTTFRAITKNLTAISKRRMWFKKKVSILFWISVRFFKLSEIESHNKNRDRPRRNISKQRVLGNALSINPSCLKVKANSEGSGDVRLILKVGKKFGIHYTIMNRLFWYRIEF